MSKANVRSLLKEQTSALHHKAESALESKARIESAHGLSNFLKCMLRAHSHFRTNCDRASELAGLEKQSKRLIYALQSDLNVSVEIPKDTQANDDCFSLGVGYVFEGSALGASILRKRLTTSGLAHPNYLCVVTETSKIRWPQFIKYIDTCENTDTVVLGAQQAFEFIIEHAEQPHERRD